MIAETMKISLMFVPACCMDALLPCRPLVLGRSGRSITAYAAERWAHAAARGSSPAIRRDTDDRLAFEPAGCTNALLPGNRYVLEAIKEVPDPLNRHEVDGGGRRAHLPSMLVRA
jgi:hypothetical protein